MTRIYFHLDTLQSLDIPERHHWEKAERAVERTLSELHAVEEGDESEEYKVAEAAFDAACEGRDVALRALLDAAERRGLDVVATYKRGEGWFEL